MCAQQPLDHKIQGKTPRPEKDTSPRPGCHSLGASTPWLGVAANDHVTAATVLRLQACNPLTWWLRSKGRKTPARGEGPKVTATCVHFVFFGSKLCNPKIIIQNVIVLIKKRENKYSLNLISMKCSRFLMGKKVFLEPDSR